MMRSMYSGVAGLKTHQTKMDVIGNNIANVNTVAYKSQSVTFSELMYQTTQAASGANAVTGSAGINARQIGLGVKTGAINTAITSQGASQTTNNPFDIRITGSAFFIVGPGAGGDKFFTRDGSFYVDGVGNLAMTSNGYNVMGWQVDPETMDIKRDTVSPLKIMSPENMTYPPEATTKAVVSGILDKNDSNVLSSSGKTMNLMFFDKLGYSYTAKFAVKSTGTEGQYTVELTDIIDSKNDSLKKVYNVANISDIASFGSESVSSTTDLYELLDGVTYDAAADKYYMKVGFSDAFSDYDTSRVPSIDYTIPDGTTSPQELAKGAEFTLNGSGELSKKMLEDSFDLIYEVPSDGRTPYYYYKDGDTVIELRSSSPADDWQKALKKEGLENFTATLMADGSVKFSFTQNFTIDAPTVYDSGTFTKELEDPALAYGLDTTDPKVTYQIVSAPEDGKAQITKTTRVTGNTLTYDTTTGAFKNIAGGTGAPLDFNGSTINLLGQNVDLDRFTDIDIDFSTTAMYNNAGTSTIAAASGDENKIGAGRKLGEMSGVSIQNDGRIYASYDNGMSKLLGQIAVAEFANASGLEKEGDNLYKSTQNSGDFDGIGTEVTAGGGYMTTGVLEMSNVDLSAEFTDMITTQRGFQANSRIITVSDTLLEELVNLKR